ncbi:MAG: hypothetical protein AAFV46_06165 [Cyanobacteria bacterium J06635_11]
MTDRPPISLLVVGISLSAISLYVRSPRTPSTNTDHFAPAVPARAIVIEPTTPAVTLEATSTH